MIGSGSGETGSLVVMAQKAHKLGASVITVTIHPEASDRQTLRGLHQAFRVQPQRASWQIR